MHSLPPKTLKSHLNNLIYHRIKAQGPSTCHVNQYQVPMRHLYCGSSRSEDTWTKETIFLPVLIYYSMAINTLAQKRGEMRGTKQWIVQSCPWQLWTPVGRMSLIYDSRSREYMLIKADFFSLRVVLSFCFSPTKFWLFPGHPLLWEMAYVGSWAGFSTCFLIFEDWRPRILFLLWTVPPF